MADQPGVGRSSLSPEQRAALEKRVRDAASSTAKPGAVRIPRRPYPAAPAPLSSSQQRLWVMDQLVPGNSFYNSSRTLRIEGTLDREALRRGLREIVQRHESLRTTFGSADGQPVQLVADSFPTDLPFVTLEHLSPEKRESAATVFAREDAELPFDLARGPMLRATLLRLFPETHVLQISMHHIVTDGWSMEVFLKELSVLYGAFSRGTSSALEPPRVQYADYSQWQREWLETDAASAQISHWAERLRGAPPLELPTDLSRPSDPTFRGASRTVLIGGEVLARLKSLTRTEGATLFMGLLAAFQIFLARHTGQRDVSIATPIAGRTLPELEGVIGLFVNTVIIRGEISANLTAREVIRHVRETSLDAYAHQDVPLEKLVEVLRPERSLSQNPIAQVLCVLQDASPSEFAMGDVRVTPIALPIETARFDLELHVTEMPQGLSCTLLGSTDLFLEDTIDQMLARFAVLLGSLAENPDRPADSLDLLPDAERRQLEEWNSTQSEYPLEQTMPGLFEEQVERTSDATAVVFENCRLTYRQLNERANRMARYIAKRGVGAEVLVGVCMERSIDMVVGLLGILKAGGAYVPLDPAYPQERLEFMLQDSGAHIVLTQDSLRARLPKHLEAVKLDSDDVEIQRESRENLPRRSTSKNLAYVIYTSGSTGKPKGVAIEHHSTVAFLAWAKELFSGKGLEAVLASTSICFDLSVFEIFAPLSSGGKIILSRDALQLPELTSAGEVRLVNTVPSAMTELLRMGPLPPSVETVNLAGEPLGPSLVREILRGGSVHRVFDLYGPTEDTTYSTCALRFADGPATIGRPISNKRAYILDSRHQPVPIGVAGDLYVAGAGVARGYLNRPELTAERFFPDPFRGNGARMYATGDRARFSPSGDIQFLGRLDNQVKIRGYRIEIGEIEATLGTHPNVRAAAAAVWTEDSGNKRLVGYVITRDGQQMSVPELRGFLKSVLPDHMIPSSFVFLSSLPLTPNGKVNRRELPAPDQARPNLNGPFAAPQTEAEKILAGIWSRVLKIEQIGIHDNFFDLGGDSILSIQIVSRARQAGLRLSPRQLFAHQTIADLALACGEGSSPVAPAGDEVSIGPVPLTPIQHWFLEHHAAHIHHFNQAFLLEAPSDLDREQLESAIRHLLGHHDTLRLRLENKLGEWKQTIVPTEETPVLSWIDLSQLEPTEQSARMEAIAAETQANLNTERGPIVRFVFFYIGKGLPVRLLAVIHHIGVDGVSWHILLEDLEAIYRALSAGREIALPAKSISFRKWAELLLDYSRSDRVTRELDYWISRSEGVPAGLPRDHSTGPNTARSARRVSTSLSAEETDALLQDVPSAYRTQINDVLLAALVKAFGPWTHRSPVLIDLEGHGREDMMESVDLSRTVGWFTAIFPVRLDFGGKEHLGELLKEVKEELRAIPQKGIGYGLLRYFGGPDVRDRLKTLPQAEVSFNYLGQFQRGSTRSMFSIGDGPTGPSHAPDALRRHALQLNGIILDSRLQLEWTYSENLHKRATIEDIATRYMEALRSLIVHCGSVTQTNFTPSDFPLARLGQGSLDRIVRKFGKT